MGLENFSFRERVKTFERFRKEKFDLLVIGGGITGAAVARDATLRGLKVALVEKSDFAYGTSSRSSKLIHGGLRYLENFEFSLVFEALSERTLLLKTVPHLVRPLPFYWPVYQGDQHGRGILSLGLWFYDLLALFRSPGFHRSLSKKKLLQEIPFLSDEKLQGGFRYFDASMWDDVLAVEILRSASDQSAAVANYCEALEPIWKNERIVGFKVRDTLSVESGLGEPFEIHASRTVICAGPWTDQLGEKLTSNWRPWLSPSKGVHLVFDLKRIPIPGALVMSHPEDGRISFVIPRPDFGAGVVVVGTTDGPTSKDPEEAQVSQEDVRYLMQLLQKYFPKLNLTTADILSAYVGVRPLMSDFAQPMGSQTSLAENSGDQESKEPSMPLQKVSREHHIGSGPGGVVLVAGGKYTTHRKMAEEIVDFTLKDWVEQTHEALPPVHLRGRTQDPINDQATHEAVKKWQEQNQEIQKQIPQELLSRYGLGALKIVEIQKSHPPLQKDPEGFPCLEAQLRFCIRYEMVMHLEDFVIRRIPLSASRADQGAPWIKRLSEVWAQELSLNPADAEREAKRLQQELVKISQWKSKLS